MKKILSIFMILLFGLLLTSCSSNKVTVTFYLVDVDNGSVTKYIHAYFDEEDYIYSVGDYLQPPFEDVTITNPFRDIIFTGWFTDRQATTAWNFNEDTIEQDLHLYGVFVYEDNSS